MKRRAVFGLLVLPWLLVVEVTHLLRGRRCASCGGRYLDCWHDVMEGLVR
jgi:hypothetical protein